MENLLGVFAAAFIAIFALVVIIYIAIAIFLNKFNKLVYSKGTILAWLPIANIYLLGKLTFNKLVGWLLIAATLLTGKYTVTVNGVEKVYTLLPGAISTTVSNILSLGLLGLFIYAIVKYFKIKKEKNA